MVEQFNLLTVQKREQISRRWRGAAIGKASAGLAGHSVVLRLGTGERIPTKHALPGCFLLGLCARPFRYEAAATLVRVLARGGINAASGDWIPDMAASDFKRPLEVIGNLLGWARRGNGRSAQKHVQQQPCPAAESGHFA